jgi:glycogen(starch) synthase
MKILFSSYAFRPMIGGIETVSEILAERFVVAGHQVELITETPGEPESLSYPVTRRPSLRKLLTLLQWSDVFFQNNISLRSLLPAIFLRKPIVIFHQTWIRNEDGRRHWNDRLKRLYLQRVSNIAISHAIGGDLGLSCSIVPNPYSSEVFKILPEVIRNKALVFLGRLVSDKGVDLLLDALAALAKGGTVADLTVIGEGPEEVSLKVLTQRLGLEKQVTFVGKRTGEALAEVLNQHRFLVVPSRWAEPFGVVTLEGIACGCVIIGSRRGGLAEAIGPCGVTFENDEPAALAQALKRVLSDKALEASLRAAGPAHLREFEPEVVADSLLKIIEHAK